MTQLLQKAIAKIEKLTSEQQDAIATRILAELEDDQQWDYLFEATTDEQWKRMAEGVRKEIMKGETMPLNEIFYSES